MIPQCRYILYLHESQLQIHAAAVQHIKNCIREDFHISWFTVLSLKYQKVMKTAYFISRVLSWHIHCASTAEHNSSLYCHDGEKHQTLTAQHLELQEYLVFLLEILVKIKIVADSFFCWLTYGLIDGFSSNIQTGDTFLHIWHKRPLGLKDELITLVTFALWALVVKGHFDLTKHVFGHNSRIQSLIMTKFHPNV